MSSFHLPFQNIGAFLFCTRMNWFYLFFPLLLQKKTLSSSNLMVGAILGGKQQGQGDDLVWTSRLLAILMLSLCYYINCFPCDLRLFSWGNFCLKLYIYSYKNVGLITIFSRIGSGENKPLTENHLEFWSQWDLSYFLKRWTCSMLFLLFHFKQLILLLAELVMNLKYPWEKGKN